MRMRRTIGLSLVLLLASATAMAKQAPSGDDQPVPSIKAKPAKSATAVAKPTAKPATAVAKPTAQPATAAAKPTAKLASAVAKPATKVQQEHGKAGAKAEPRRAAGSRSQPAQLPPPDRYIGSGRREVGSAAWYGGYHLGRRMASGERLDGVHPTAAHRSLPLHSLVRVTNLSNGRSIIATITDRGPVSRSLLIDVSPRVAEQLDMKRTGIAKVEVEPVAPAQNTAH